MRRCRHVRTRLTVALLHTQGEIKHQSSSEKKQLQLRPGKRVKTRSLTEASHRSHDLHQLHPEWRRTTFRVRVVVVEVVVMEVVEVMVKVVLKEVGWRRW